MGQAGRGAQLAGPRVRSLREGPFSPGQSLWVALSSLAILPVTWYTPGRGPSSYLGPAVGNNQWLQPRRGVGLQGGPLRKCCRQCPPRAALCFLLHREQGAGGQQGWGLALFSKKF